MKMLILNLLAMSLTYPAFSSDRLENEIVCEKVTQPGEADNGVEIIIQSNPTAWAKRALIISKGYFGPELIASFQIPVTDPVVTTPSYFVPSRYATYSARGFSLHMDVVDSKGQKLLGPAKAQITVPQYGLLEVELTCQRVR